MKSLSPKRQPPRLTHGRPVCIHVCLVCVCACAVVVVVAVAVLVLCKQVEWYKYSYSGAKDLETKKAHRKFFRSKARKFLKDKGLE